MERYSILQNDFHRCYICNRVTNIEIHEVFFGRNRKNSIEDGCCIALCRKHHTGSAGIHFDKQLDDIVKERMQRCWMEHYNLTEEDFIRRYRRNYLNRW